MENICRIQKMLSMCGISSRRKAEEMIINKRVTVNGVQAQIGDKVDISKDVVLVDGERVYLPQEKIYIALHKPRGFVTTMSDERSRRCVADLVEDINERVYPVGRLDKDSEGLLLMTNDGEFANLIMHPGSRIPKVYRVTVRPRATEPQLVALSTGVMIDGVLTAPARVGVIEEKVDRTILEIVLYEGKNREIRKMCDAVSLEVARLKRIAEGPVRLGMLERGAYRELTDQEVASLFKEGRKGEKRNDSNITGNKRKGNRNSKRYGNRRG